MYNIHSHYEFVYQFTQHLRVKELQLAYFFPFGSSNIEQLEQIGSYEPILCLLCYDQEPIKFSNNYDLFCKYNKKINTKKFTVTEVESVFFSKILNYQINIPLVSMLNKRVTTILLNTEKDSKEKNKVLSHFNYIDCYYFFHGLAAADWYRGYEYYAFTPVKQRIIKKKYISYNRITGNSRIYRFFLVASLYQKDLLEHGHVSFSKTCPVHGNLKPDIIAAIKNYNLKRLECQNIFKIYEQLSDLRIDTPPNKSIENKSFNIGPIYESQESFLHVVTETCFWETKKHLTEKIFKPIVLRQPFVLLGCANNLSYLKEYGFKTFDKWWDESYDNCQDPLDRLEMVVSIIENICQKSNDELKRMLLEMEEVLDYNFNRFYSKDFVNDIWNELSINLSSAIAQLPPPT